MILVAVGVFNMDFLKCRFLPWSTWGQGMGDMEHRKKQ